MYRYLAFVWDRRDRHAGARVIAQLAQIKACVGEWHTAAHAPGLLILHAGARAGVNDVHLLEHRRGALLGRVFRAHFDGGYAAAADVVDTDEAALFRRFWGRYVAFIQDVQTGAARVLRDPSGSLPCFFMRHAGVHLFFSDLEDCASIAPALSINWRHLRRFVAYSALMTGETGFNEVGEVRPGEMLAIHGESITRSWLWNPLSIAQTDSIEQYEEAVWILRRTVRACVNAWAGSYPTVVHKLSGGLDSSVVAACLRAAPAAPAVTCLNYFSAGRNEDERRYAQLAASHLRLPLIERPVSMDFPLRDILNIRASAKPWFYMYDMQHAPAETELARELGAGAVFTGSGGDSVFYQGRADLAVNDYLWKRGLNPGMFGVAYDAARIARSSLWPLLKRAFVARMKSRPWHPLSVMADLGVRRTVIADEVIQEALGDEELIYPAIRIAAPPGLTWHIACVTVPVSYYDSFRREGVPERINPLMSQPIVELALRIPKFVWIEGGRDRALVRTAFSCDLPRQIVRRRAKGSADASIRSFLDANLPFVRELLLDGCMVREGLLDRARLELYLSRTKSPADAQYNEILQQHLSTEAWLQSCKSLERRAVA